MSPVAAVTPRTCKIIKNGLKIEENLPQNGILPPFVLSARNRV